MGVTVEFKNFKIYYDNIVSKKNLIKSKKELFCIVYPSDLSFNSLIHLLQSKFYDDSDYHQKLFGSWKIYRSLEQSFFEKKEKDINKIVK